MIFVIIFLGALGRGFWEVKIGTDVFFIIVEIFQVVIELDEAFLDPDHEFLLHDVAADTDLSEGFGVGFGEHLAIEVMFF